MYEHFFQCPYCWEAVSMLLDASIDRQSYIEDCEVCCNPISINLLFEKAQLQQFSAQSTEQ